jgi:hypothetical protein
MQVCDPVSASCPPALQHLHSDHNPILISLSKPQQPNIKPHPQPLPHYRWNTDKFDEELFGQQLELALQDFIPTFDAIHYNYPAQPHLVIDTAVESLTLSITQTAEAVCGKTLIKPKYNWWWRYHPKLPQLQADKRRARMRLSRSNTTANQLAYRAARNAFVSACRAARRAAWQDLVSTIESDDGKRNLLWSAWRRTQSADDIAPHCVVDEHGHLPVSIEQGLNNLCRHYARVSTAPVIPPNDAHGNDIRQRAAAAVALLRSHFNDPRNQRPPSAVPNNFTLESIEAACRRLNINKAHGPDDIAPIFIRPASRCLVSALHAIFNYSFYYGAVPTQWKQANAASLFKGSGERSLGSSCRPISLLSCLGKVQERLVQPKLVEITASQLTPLQAGFRHGRCANEQVYRLVHAARQSFAKRSYLDVVFLDIQKAFDTAWHDMIIIKCARMGVRGHLLLWLHNFLQGRSMRCVWKGHVSDWHSITAGVPQGAILSPLLYNIFINDILDDTEGLDAAMFADDIAIWPFQLGRAGYRILRDNLPLLTAWAQANFCSFGIPKCALIRFTHLTDPPDPQPLLLQSQPIPILNHYKYLGIILDSKLDFQTHFTHTLTKARTSSALISRLFSACTIRQPPGPAIAIHLIKATVLPIITYGMAIWFDPNRSKKWQDAFLRTLLLPLRRSLVLPLSTHRHSMLVEFALLPFQELYALHALNFAKHLLLCDVANPARTLFIRDYNAANAWLARPPHRRVRRCRNHWTFGNLLVESQLQCKLNVIKIISDNLSNYMLRQHLLKLSQQRLQRGTSGHLRTVTTDIYTPHFYRTCSKFGALARAHFRLGRTLFNADLHRHNMSPTPHCQHHHRSCLLQPEDAEHVFFHCPRFQATRTHTLNTLSTFGMRACFTLNYILCCHNPPPTQRHHWPAFHQTIDNFLESLHSLSQIF